MTANLPNTFVVDPLHIEASSAFGAFQVHEFVELTMSVPDSHFRHLQLFLHQSPLQDTDGVLLERLGACISRPRRVCSITELTCPTIECHWESCRSELLPSQATLLPGRKLQGRQLGCRVSAYELLESSCRSLNRLEAPPILRATFKTTLLAANLLAFVLL